VVIRNAQGFFLAAEGVLLPHVSSAAMAEALAMLNGLKLAKNLGFSMVEAESDSLEVFQYFLGEEEIWNEATAIYAEIMLVAGSIGVVEFGHCRREMNKVAHDIARHSYNLNSGCN
jgi:ribonuclease HI